MNNLAYLAVAGGLALAYWMGPRPDTKTTWQAPDIDQPLDQYLQAVESQYDDLVPDTQKQIVWANSPGEKTPWSIVYLHGFSASPFEIRPVPDAIAKNNNANLYFTRFAGHGRSSPDAMLEGSLAKWSDDVAEALKIGREIGDKTLVMATSNGGMLAALAMDHPQMSTQIDAAMLFSPNFELKAASTQLLNMPWGQTILPKVMGEERSFEPLNALQAKYWTNQYPSKAVFPMAAGLRELKSIDFSSIDKPLLVFYSDDDQVISPKAIQDVLASYGGAHESVVVNDSEDPVDHVITGEAMSPNTNERIIEQASAWMKSVMDAQAE